MEMKEASEKFNSLISAVKPIELESFLQWAKSKIESQLENLTPDNSRVVLDSIREDIRQRLPITATAPTETVLCPTKGTNADCDSATTVHVDAFLYDEDTVDEMCDAGKMSRNYCTKCLSQSVQPLTFITHSASVSQVKYIYEFLLQDLRNKTVLDVGSRTGALLYGAYLYSEAQRIVGVELDQTFCELQRSIVKKYEMSKRILIMHGDIMLQTKVLQSSDVVILNNVFEFFMPADKQIHILYGFMAQCLVTRLIWKFLCQTLRKAGAIIITIPSIEESLSNVELQLDVGNWLAPIDTQEKRKEAATKYFNDSEDSDLDEIFMYRVL